MLLAWLAHRHLLAPVTVAHAVSPAVPPEATQRVKAMAAKEGWQLEIVSSGEFADEDYLSNPVNRCYFCKSNLYESLTQIAEKLGGHGTIVSGANLNDLGEYRPGLDAAAQRAVRHPWIEAEFGKSDIRVLARSLDLPFADLPASPCLASRLYTGTRVTSDRLMAVHAAENLVRERTGLTVVRCRLDRGVMKIEVPSADRGEISDELIAAVAKKMISLDPGISKVLLDEMPYSPGRAFVGHV